MATRSQNQMEPLWVAVNLDATVEGQGNCGGHQSTRAQQTQEAATSTVWLDLEK